MVRVRHQAKTSRWAARQNRDPYVRAARRAGFRARAVFKLEEIDQKYRLIKPGSVIIDLGSAPGSWSQYAAGKVRAPGQIIAVDLLAMQAIDKVNFIRGDFTDEAVRGQIAAALAPGAHPVDLVLSDLAPNISGISGADQARAERLQRAVLEFCRRCLKPGGKLLTKLLAGESAVTTRAQIIQCFEQTRTIKPAASRAESKEFYLLARGYRGCKGGGHGDKEPEAGRDEAGERL